MIEFKNVLFHYSNQGPPVINNFNLTINKGEWVALIGHNGSGKSTLAKHINGLLMPQQGEVLVDNEVVTDEGIWEIRQKVGMVFQNPENQFVGTTVLDDVVFGLENMRLSRQEMERRVDESLTLVGLSDYKWKEPFNLSGGQKQRLAIAGILAMLPSVLILDEATTMLDPVSRDELINTISRLHEQRD
ncbi:ATP-binding cassette domain-containing protein [Piscibacillus salipiscarius]|uniref:ATP-binding cassette domain-containing protein n=1 Tax=Piscibacillus salipiscarius TaxID=299480 RepID=UPI000ADAE02C